MMGRTKQVLASLVLCVLLSACSQEAVKPEPTQPKPVQPTPEQPSPPVVTFPYTAPFTGLGTNQRLENRPIMVMVSNVGPARPQSGLDKADMVYEILAEGEITRFLAIFHSQKPQVIGPVRSIRPYFIQIGTGFDAVMVHAGGSPEALETLAHADYSNVNEIASSRYFWRESFRNKPHNLYTDLDKIDQALKDKGMRSTGELPYFPFLPADAVITEGAPAKTVDVTFHSLYKVGYVYDEKTKKYWRFTQGKPHMDLTTKQQLSVTNLLVIATKHQTLDKELRRKVDVVGPGDGYLFQQGKVRKVKWKRSGGVIRAYSDNAMTKELPLLPGNTWINIVPTVPGLVNEVKYR